MWLLNVMMVMSIKCGLLKIFKEHVMSQDSYRSAYAEFRSARVKKYIEYKHRALWR